MCYKWTIILYCKWRKDFNFKKIYNQFLLHYMKYSETTLICTPKIWAPPLLCMQYFLLGGLNVEFELMGLVFVPHCFLTTPLETFPTHVRIIIFSNNIFKTIPI